MILGFYYHISVFQKNNKLYCPGYIGVFIDSLAVNVDELILILHEKNSLSNTDYELKNKNIKFISLGEKTPAWHRLLFNKKILKNHLRKIKKCDTLIVRSPSPLSPFFKKYLKKTNVIFLIVGDYEEGMRMMKITSLKDIAVNLFLRLYRIFYMKQINQSHIIVNSQALFNKYKNKCEKINFVRTTTLKKQDFYKRDDTCKNERINLLFSGRIEIGKGIWELIYAFSDLTKLNQKLHLNIVGWEENGRKIIENKILKYAEENNIQEKIKFHGFKNIGNDLNKIYRKSDIFVLPSYHEGFPRTIWEAMANSLPVICTSVGSIPFELKDKNDSIIIKPKKIDEIKKAIIIILENNKLRKKIISNGFKKASLNTLEIQTKKLINFINND